MGVYELVREFPSAPLERIARKAGAKRVSTSAVMALKAAVLEEADRIAADAIAVSRHAGRVTVKDKDIRIVARKK